jgi:kynureninase
VAEELLRRDIIVDYRPNAGIRVAPHFYNSEADVDRAVAVMDAVLEETVRVE